VDFILYLTDVTLEHGALRIVSKPDVLAALGRPELSASDEEQAALRKMERAVDFIDTANLYTKGHSEKIIGDHTGRHSSKRDRVVLATKFSGNHYPGDPNGGGSGRKSVIAACEQSLRRLQTDYIDLYWLHNGDKHTPIEETLATLHDLVSAGEVRYVGYASSLQPPASSLQPPSRRDDDQRRALRAVAVGCDQEG
jgi:aryl-alcohol dehydrogenase-like predicted oxidoreductase